MVNLEVIAEASTPAPEDLRLRNQASAGAYCVTLASALHGSHFATLLADSGLTRDAEHGGAARHSFFGQIEQQDGTSVREQTNKICRVGPRAIATFAGDVIAGTRVLRLIRDFHESGDLTWLREPHRFSEYVAGGERLELAIAYVEDEHPRVAMWTTRTPDASKLLPISQACTFGSGANAFTPRYDNVVRGGAPQWGEHQLPLVLSAALQAQAVHVVPQQSKVSGMFVAATLTAEGVTWLPDVTFLMYDDAAATGNVWLTACFTRDDVPCVATRTPQLQQMVGGETGRGVVAKLLVSPLGTDREEWFRKHGDQVNELTRNVKSEYFVFISRKGGAPVIIGAGEERRLHNSLVSLKSDLGALHLTISRPFRQTLLRAERRAAGVPTLVTGG